MNLFTMRHGPHTNGKTHIGSLELLATAEDDGTPNLTQFISPLPRLENLEAERAQPGDVDGDSYVGIFDVVIMNPPFTRNDIRNRQYTASNRKRIQDREKEVVDFVRQRDPEAGEAIDHTNASSFFYAIGRYGAKKGNRCARSSSSDNGFDWRIRKTGARVSCKSVSDWDHYHQP